MLQCNNPIIKHKVGLLNLAGELGNISQACKIMGLSRDTFYRYHAVKENGVDALYLPVDGFQTSRIVWMKVLNLRLFNMSATVLAKVAVEDNSESVRAEAVQKLTAVEKEYRAVQLIRKWTPAFDTVPEEHRKHLMPGIWRAIQTLSDPEVVNKFGEIVSVEVYWHPETGSYTSRGKILEMPGEDFNCSIELKKLARPLSHSWSTNFPLKGYYLDSSDPRLKFLGANVHAGDLLGPIFEQSSQSLLAKIAVQDEDDTVRRAAVQKLADQALLAKIAVEDKDDSVRRAAEERLTSAGSKFYLLPSTKNE